MLKREMKASFPKLKMNFSNTELCVYMCVCTYVCVYICVCVELGLFSSPPLNNLGLESKLYSWPLRSSTCSSSNSPFPLTASISPLMKSYMKLRQKINAEELLEIPNETPSDPQGAASGPLNETQGP